MHKMANGNVIRQYFFLQIQVFFSFFFLLFFIFEKVIYLQVNKEMVYNPAKSHLSVDDSELAKKM